MYDQPTASELIDAVQSHLEQSVIPAVRQNRKLYFQTLVAINVLKIVNRELDLREVHLAQFWASLNVVQNSDEPLPASTHEAHERIEARNKALCQAIRAGQYSGEQWNLLFEHIESVTIKQLEVANPKFLQVLHTEQQE